MLDYAVLAEALGSVGAFALIAWLLRRVFTHTIPRLANSFEESLVRQQETFQKQLYDQQQLFHAELSQCRNDFRSELKEQRADFKEQIKEEREMFIGRLDRMADAIQSLEQAIREANLINRGRD